MTLITPDMYIKEILSRIPGAAQVFIANGFDDFADNDTLVQLAPFLRLKTALNSRNINIDMFVKLLKEKAEDTKEYNINLSAFSQEHPLNLLALLPCPLKLPLQDAFENFIGNSAKDKNIKLDCLIEGNANNQLSYYGYVDQFEDIGDIPDIVISPGVNSFFHRRFIEKFIDKGYFIDAAGYIPETRLMETGIKDPGGNYTVIAMNLLVMVADNEKMDNLDIPRRWGDLLEPCFEKQVAIRGHADFFCETTLLTIYKAYGFEGIRRLAKSVRYGWHPAQMAKTAGGGTPEAPAISVMPYFYTKTIKHKDKVTVIWPEDGAIISPVTMLVKATDSQNLRSIAAFFTGDKAGKICAGACFPSMHPGVDNKLPAEASFNWVGWDFIKNNDIGSLINDLNREFLSVFKS